MTDGGGDLGDLARQLRAGVGGELRADAEEGERLAAQAALRRRGLADVALAARDRGDVLVVVLPGARFRGRVVHAARDLLTVAAAAGTVHVRLDGAVALHVDGAAVAAHREPDPGGAPSFKAKLYELEMAGSQVEVSAGVLPAPLRGRIRAVALDHVLVQVADGPPWAVGLPAVRSVLEPSRHGPVR